MLFYGKIKMNSQVLTGAFHYTKKTLIILEDMMKPFLPLPDIKIMTS